MSKEKECKTLYGSVLEDASKAIKENATYGHPHVNHYRIGKLWNTYLSLAMESDPDRYLADGGIHMTSRDVVVMMILLKISRIIQSPHHHDSWVDIAGYAALGDTMGDDY